MGLVEIVGELVRGGMGVIVKLIGVGDYVSGDRIDSER